MSSPFRIEVIEDLNASPERELELAMLYLEEIKSDISAEALEDQVSEMLQSNEVIAIVVNDHSVVAMAGLRRMFGGTTDGMLVDVATASSHKREGLGTKVVAELENYARNAGMVNMHVFPGPGSHAFYESLGYRYKPGVSMNLSWSTKDLIADPMKAEVSSDRHEISPGLYDVPTENKFILESRRNIPFTRDRLARAQALMGLRATAIAESCLMGEACGVGHIQYRLPHGQADRARRTDILEAVCDGECPLDLKVVEVPKGTIEI